MKSKLIIFVSFFFFISTSYVFSEVTKTYVQTASSENATQPSGIEFNPDGTKVFISKFGAGTNLYQYTLDTPFDISTIDAGTEVILDLNAGDDDIGNKTIENLTFNSDGTKIYAIGFGGGMNVHTLSTPYDFSSFTQDANDGKNWATYLTPGDGEIRPHIIKFNNDGTKMYLNDANVDANTNVVEYDLATPYLPGSATGTRDFNISDETDNAIQDVDFDDDGTRMYVVESRDTLDNNNNLIVYKLSTPFDVTSAKHVGTLNTFSDANNGGIRPLGMTFNNDGMKLYLTDWKSHEIHEYDLICPYGIVICELDETNVQTDTASQIEFAKDVIKHNTSTIFRRFDWLRRNENNLSSYSQNIKLNLSPILSFLPDKIEKPFTNTIYSKVKALTKKNKKHKKNKRWSFWSNGDLTIGERDSNKLKPREIETSGLTFGVDRKFNKGKFFGLALRYGNGETDILRSLNKFETESLSLNLYSSIKLNKKLNLNSLIGSSILEIDKLASGINIGGRNGKQIFSAIDLQASDGYTNLNIMPTAKIDFGITELSEYNQFNTSRELLANHDLITFETGNLTTGLKFDNIKTITNGSRSINGSFEYVHDFSSDVDYEFRNAGDTNYQTKTYNANSIHNLKSNIGFERLLDNGFTFGFNFENFQGFDDNSINQNSLYLKLSHIRDEDTKIALDYDPLQNNILKLNYAYKINNFDISVNSNYDFSDEDNFNTYLKLSNKF